MKRRLFHLYLKSTLDHKYYGSLKAIFIDTTNPDLRVSKFTLDRFDFVQPYENEVCVIRKGFMQSTGDIRGGCQIAHNEQGFMQAHNTNSNY